MYFVKDSIACFRHDEILMEPLKLLNIFITILAMRFWHYFRLMIITLKASHIGHRIL